MTKAFEEAFKEMAKEETKITVNVKDEWKKIKEDNGWTWKEIIGLGMKAKQNNPQLIGRLTALELSIKRLNEKTMKMDELIRDHI